MRKDLCCSFVIPESISNQGVGRIYYLIRLKSSQKLHPKKLQIQKCPILRFYTSFARREMCEKLQVKLELLYRETKFVMQ